MLKLYRWPSDDWRKLGAELPPEIIWVDLLSPSDEEKAFVERRLNIRVPSEESLGEIEASSRLIFEHDTLYLSSPSVRLDEDREAQLTSIGFIIGPRVLVTVRFWPLPTFDKVAKEMDNRRRPAKRHVRLHQPGRGDGRSRRRRAGAVGATADHAVAVRVQGRAGARKRPVRSSRRMREALANVGDLADRLAKARDVLLTVGRIAAFAGEVGSDWITPASKRRLEAVSKDVASLSDYELRLSDKIQLLLDAILGFISIQQNDLFKILTIVSVVGVPPTIMVGIWGMNFKFMPELGWTYGYPLAWLAVIASGVVPLLWFKWRGWFD